MLNKKAPFVWYGGDYNPDQWDDETLEQDIRYFKEAGINVVTLPVFSWAKLEPSEGEYRFEWLDRILERLLENGIYVIMATPTTAQPAWLSRKYPEVLPVDMAGRKRTHGMRVYFCVNSEKYRERAAAMAKQMAERYQNYPGLIAWHVANEYGTYCYCDNCQRKFRLWLKDRYGSVEKLNESWTASFWGRTVYDFDEVMLPTELNDDYRFNPAVQLDYMRFVSDSTLECYLNEARILKEYTPGIPVYTNISGFIKKLDQFKMVEQMDCAGWDNYPAPGTEMSLPALKHDIMRALKDGKPYIIAEQSPNQQNWQPYNKLKRPGEIRTIAYQGLARGADACLFFQMRQSVGGQEKFHGAVISHEGTDDTRIFREISGLGRELSRLGDIFLDGRVPAETGILFDWESWWALELASGPSQDMDYLEQVHTYYKAFYDKNIPVDILKKTSDFSGYKLLVVPLLYMMGEETARKLEEFVEGGGILLATYRTGVVDENDRCVNGNPPGTLKRLLGLWVEETDALRPEERNRIVPAAEPAAAGRGLEGNFLTKGSGRREFEAGFVCDILRLTGAAPLAVYGQDFYQGTPCVTVNRRGGGKAFYIACEPDGDFLAEFADLLCREAGLKRPLPTGGKVEVCVRKSLKAEITFVINHSEEPGMVDFGENTCENLIDGRILTGKCSLTGREVLAARTLVDGA